METKAVLEALGLDPAALDTVARVLPRSMRVTGRCARPSTGGSLRM